RSLTTRVWEGRQRPAILIRSSFLLPRPRVLITQRERLGPISGDPLGYRQGLFTFQGHRQTSASNSMAIVFWSAATTPISGEPLAQARRAPFWESRPLIAAQPQR